MIKYKIGDVFGRFVLLEYFYKNRHMGIFKCLKCGKVLTRRIEKDYNDFSCNCKDRKKENAVTRQSAYSNWQNMKSRCNNKNSINFHNYGGIGITICKEWEDPKTFCDWANKNGYKDGLQIDRINNDGNYEPSNCRWVTQEENCAIGRLRKKRNNTSGYNGVSYSNNNKKWWAYIYISKKQTSIGFFDTIQDAVDARIKKEIDIFGQQKTNL